MGYDLNNRVFAGGVADLTSVLVRYSDDNGLLWSRAKVADGSEGRGIEWALLAVDTSPSSPFKNSIYLTTVHGGGLEGGQDTRVFVSHSSDGAKHWKGVPLDRWQFPSVDAFPSMSVGGDGTVYVTWMRCSRPQLGFCVKDGVPILLSKSTDGGMTWTPPSVVAAPNLTPGNCLFGCMPNVGIAAQVGNEPLNAVVGSGPTARVYVVFYNWTGTQMQVEVATSTNGGKTFGSPVPVSNSGVGDQFVPSISAAADGTIAICWLDRRNDPANLKYQPFLATSKDGQTFGSSFLLTSYQTDLSPFISGIPGPFPTLWAGSAAYYLWPDFRTGLFRSELGGVQF